MYVICLLQQIDFTRQEQAVTGLKQGRGLGLGLGFITTDCTGYATSRLSDDSRGVPRAKTKRSLTRSLSKQSQTLSKVFCQYVFAMVFALFEQCTASARPWHARNTHTEYGRRYV